MPTTASTDFTPWLDAERTLAYFKGRVALYAILEAAGIGPGDEVLLPGFTCVAVPAAILYRRATPVYYDVHPLRLNGDPALALAKVTPRTRALVVQHTFGAPTPIDELRAVARERKLLLVEDCAHALGATVGDRPVGTLGDAAFCSLQWSKPVTTGLGGIARFNDAELYRRAWTLHGTAYGRPPWPDRILLSCLASLHRHLYRPRLFWTLRAAYRWLGLRGWVSTSSSADELASRRMPPEYRRRCVASRRKLESTLTAIPGWTEHRRSLARRYDRTLTPHGFFSQALAPNTASSWLRYATLVERRENVLARARRARIEIGDWFNAPVHPAAERGEDFGYVPGTCPRAEWIARRIVNLPTHHRVDHEEADRICRFLLATAAPSRLPLAWGRAALGPTSPDSTVSEEAG